MATTTFRTAGAQIVSGKDSGTKETKDPVRLGRPARALRNYLRIKILSLGEGGVGKSCLIKRYCEEKFESRYIATIGVDFGVRTVRVDAPPTSSQANTATSSSSSSSLEVKVNFWDLSGHPEFYEIRQSFYKDTQGLLLVYDVTSRRSFSSLDQWLSESAKFAARPVHTVLVANKADLSSQRVVTEAEGRAWAQTRGYAYWETSACTGHNVNDMFNSVFRAVTTLVPRAI